MDGKRITNLFADVEKARAVIDSDLFRPPYGRATAFQIRNLIEKLQYKIVMWDVLSGDFDPKVNGKEAAERVIENAVWQYYRVSR